METLRSDLLQKLNDIAAREQRSADEVLEELLGNYQPRAATGGAPDPLDAYGPPGSLARLAAAGRQMPPLPTSGDVSERADEILEELLGSYQPRAAATGGGIS